MPIQIKSTKDVKVNGVKLVVYGAAGIGKTVLCSTAPKPIIISAEQGLLSLQDKDIPYIEVKSLKDIGDAFNILKDNKDFNTICLDSLTEIADVVHTKSRKEVEAEPTQRGKVDLRKSYMLLANRMMPMIRNFRDIQGKNVVFTAQQKRYEDEDIGKADWEPMLPGQVISTSLPYMVDIVLNMAKDKQEKRYLQCHSKYGFLIKDRSGKLAAKEPPNLTQLFNKIIGITETNVINI